MNKRHPHISYILLGLLAVVMFLYSQSDLTLENGEDLNIQLVTIGPGDELTNWWGHNGLIVENSASGISYFYNYGLYSFDDNFIINFVKGRLIFQVGAFTTEDAIDYYRSENREIHVQTLQLSPDKKLEIARKLKENIRPENRDYLYHHYQDNCATRIRDLIDQAVGGQLKSYTDVPGRMTLRQLTRCHTHRHFIWTWLLMFPMNDSIDKPIKRWENMFLPGEMEKIFSEFTYKDADNQLKSLVIKNQTIYAATGRARIPDAPPNYLFLTLLLSLSVSLAVLFTAFLYRRGHPRFFGLMNVVAGLFAGGLGIFLTLVSLFTDHTIAYYNENLFLVNPLTGLIPFFALAFAFRKKSAGKWLGYIWYGHVTLGAVLLVLKLFSPFDQDNSLALVTFIPLYCAFARSFFKFIAK